MDAELDRGIALVTGACAAPGAEVVEALARRGAVVAAVDGDGPRLAELVERLRGEGLRVAGRQVDVGSSAAVDALVDQLEREYGPIDALVAVAGVVRPAPALATTDADWAHSFAVNADGVFHACRAVAARMVARRRGVVATVAPAGPPGPGAAAWAASRAAAVAYTECLALEVARDGVHCAVVAPDEAHRVADDISFLLAPTPTR